MEPLPGERPLALQQQQMIVTSCEEEDDDAQDSVSCSVDSLVPDDLFDDQADEEDEAYVYQHLRSGLSESALDMTTAAKPRNSDAVLSCPGCFRIVCMDCQRHDYYKNQYRAMFVMSVMVRWDLCLQYDSENRCLVPYSMDARKNAILDDHTPVPCGGADNPTIYYTVCCAHCHTTVAALDMTEEVYHFSGCLASS